MRTYLKTLKKFVEEVPLEAKFLNILKNIHMGMNICGNKIISATKFIDYFVHDILDYTMINKDSTKFIKDNSVFDIRSCVDEILTI